MNQEPSSRCYRCFRPLSLCFCDFIPRVQNQTSVIILQHRRERFHPFNSARIVAQSLTRCQLLVDRNADLAKRFAALPLADNVGLLYPGDNARLLSEATTAEPPDELIILDGTWPNAKTLFGQIPRLQSLPRYRLAPTAPSNFRIRREPNAEALSTLEATVAALRALEPHTKGFDRLLAAFDKMVDDQLQHKASNWRRNMRRKRGATNIPRALTGDLGNVVVAYGELPPGRSSQPEHTAPSAAPFVYFTAQRIASGEYFQSAIESPSFADAVFLEHLKLPAEIAEQAVSLSEFQRQLRGFLRPADQLVVYHPNTARSLRRLMIGPATGLASPIVLKSVQIHDQQPQQTLSDFLVDQGFSPADFNRGTSRSTERLALAIALVRYLNHYSSSKACHVDSH